MKTRLTIESQKYLAILARYICNWSHNNTVFVWCRKRKTRGTFYRIQKTIYSSSFIWAILCVLPFCWLLLLLLLSPINAYFGQLTYLKFRRSQKNERVTWICARESRFICRLTCTRCSLPLVYKIQNRHRLCCCCCYCIWPSRWNNTLYHFLYIIFNFGFCLASLDLFASFSRPGDFFFVLTVHSVSTIMTSQFATRVYDEHRPKNKKSCRNAFNFFIEIILYAYDVFGNVHLLIPWAHKAWERRQ